MYKTLFRFLLVVTFFGISFSAVAIDYTAKHSKKSSRHTKSSDKLVNDKGCTNKDMRAIKKFDRKAKNEIEEWHERNEFSTQIVRGATGLSTKELIRMSKKIDVDEIVGGNFFTSDKYTAMKKVYKRCDLKAPMIKIPPMFWLPGDHQDVLGADL